MVKDNLECNCSCHSGKNVILHCMPCCEQCPDCNRNIKSHYLSKHLKECVGQVPTE